MTSGHPHGNGIVSIVMPMRNEARIVRDVVSSVLAQEVPGHEIEVLVVDGRSTDGSRAIVEELAARDRRVRVLDNPHQLTPHALNIGLRAASGELVGIFGSHALYDADYIRICLEELVERGAVGCSGRIVTTPANDSVPARLVAWTLASPFASSGRSFRTAPEGFADTIAYPVFRKRPLLELGGYNERLARNQDNDMNERLRAAGHRLYVTWRTHARYRTQPDVRALLRYAYRAGHWNFVTLRENPKAMRGRHFAPLIFVGATIGLLLAALLASVAQVTTPAAVLAAVAAAAIVLHLAIGTATAARIAVRERSGAALLVPPLILAFHLSYGLGTLSALVRRARPPVTRPLEASGGELSA